MPESFHSYPEETENFFRWQEDYVQSLPDPCPLVNFAWLLSVPRNLTQREIVTINYFTSPDGDRLPLDHVFDEYKQTFPVWVKNVEKLRAAIPKECLHDGWETATKSALLTAAADLNFTLSPKLQTQGRRKKKSQGEGLKLAQKLGVKGWQEVDAMIDASGTSIGFKSVESSDYVWFRWEKLGWVGIGEDQRLLIELAESENKGVANPKRRKADPTGARRQVVKRINIRLREAFGFSGKDRNPIYNRKSVTTSSFASFSLQRPRRTP